MGKYIDLTGRKFGRLLVVSISDIKSTSGSRKWNCVCDCGNTVLIRSDSLLSTTKSCGCLQREAVTKHGMNHTSEYHIWEGIKQRCLNSNFHAFDNYGGRGIQICDRWLNSFENF